MSSATPEAKPAQPKDAQDQSGAKDLVASSGEQEKRPEVEAVPVSTPPSSEKPPIVPPDSTAAATTPDPKKDGAEEDDAEEDDAEEGGQDTTVPTETAAAPATATPRVPDAKERMRRRRLLVVHTRFAKFFSWILLLGFVILPSTFTRPQDGNDQSTSSSSTTPTGEAQKLRDEALNHIRNYSLFAIGYTCCLINGIAICWLWRLRKNEPEWLVSNLFSAGLINAFSGLITTFVNFFGVEGGQIGSSTKSTLVLASACTFIYGVLTIIYTRKRELARRRRGSRASSAMV